MNSQMVIEDITRLVQSGCPCVHLQSHEYLRVDGIIADIAETLAFSVREWSLANGYVDYKNKRRISLEGEYSLCQSLTELESVDLHKQIIVIKNVALAIDGNGVSMVKLQELILRIQTHHQGNAVVMLCATETLNYTELKSLVTTVVIPPLVANEIERLMDDFCKSHNIIISTDIKKRLMLICTGMQEQAFTRLLNDAKNKYGKRFGKEIIDLTVDVKKQLVAQSGVITFIEPKVSIDSIGGLDNLKQYIRKKKRIVDNIEEAQKFGVQSPKGILLVGVPGCGKSLTAQAVAALFELPLLRLDIGSLMGKYVGESEANLQKALRVAEETSPCVLWMDELEKAFSGVGGQGGAAETTTRLFGYFLTWLQEKRKMIFVVATTNNLELPPELLRRGRFDEIFFISLPNQNERQDIIKIHLKKAVNKSRDISVKKLSDATDGFSGSDLEALINEALELAFIEGNPLSQKHLDKTLSNMVSIKDVLKEKMDGYDELVKKYQLKSASLKAENKNDITSHSQDTDVIVREDVASNGNTPKEILRQLSSDADVNVRLAVLKNPNCPPDLLKNIVAVYHQQKIDFSQPVVWSESSMVSAAEFEKAIQHPNMSVKAICDLYADKRLSAESFCKIIANKDNMKPLKGFLKQATIKVPQNIQYGVVKAIHVQKHDVVSKEQALIDLDDDTGNNKKIGCPVQVAIIQDVFVSLNERRQAGEQLLSVLVPEAV